MMLPKLEHVYQGISQNLISSSELGSELQSS